MKPVPNADFQPAICPVHFSGVPVSQIKGQFLISQQTTASEPTAAPSPFPPPVAEWFAELARSRRSIRRYTPRPIARAVLEELLATACWAPSAHNRQPWRFCVVTDTGVKEELSRRMGEQWRRDLSADGADPGFIERRVAVSHARLTGAGALILAATCMEDMDVYTDARRNQAEWTMAVQSVALACQNLLLAAHAHGLGACWMCAPLFAPELVRDTLNLPGAWHPQALITLGYPAEEKTRERVDPALRIVWR